MADAQVKTVKISGVPDVDKLVKLDIGTHQNGGSIGYTDVGTTTDKKLDDKVNIQGINGVVSKTVLSVSGKGSEVSVAADLGNAGAKKPIGIICPEDNWQFKPYLLSDIINKITTVNVSLKGYDLYIESYSYSGKTIDCLNDLAGLIFGYVNYNSSSDTYEIIGGDVSINSNSSDLTTLNIPATYLISYELTEEKNSELSLFGKELISAAKEIAQIRAAIADMVKDKSNADLSSHILTDTLSFTFGTKNGFTPIGPELEVESTEWDYWYQDELGEKFVNQVGDSKFVSKVDRYFKAELISDLVATTSSDGTPSTVTRAHWRGLRTLHGATLWYRLKGFSSINDIYGRGYTINLTSLGLPSITDYNQNKQNTSSKTPYDDCYHTLYEIKSREIKVKVSDTSTAVYTDYVPYIAFHMTSFLYGASYAAKKAQKTASGDTTDPTDIEIGEILTQFQYGATVEFFAKSVTTSLKYKGVLDKHNRLVSESGQVTLVLINSSTLGGMYFYGPLEGMDMSFITSNKPLNPDPPDPDVYVISSALLDDYFDETAINASLLTAWDDLVKLCQAQTPMGVYTTTDAGYPKFISEYIANPKDGQTPAIIGAVVSETSSILNSDKEVTIPLSLQEYTTANKKRRQLERKLKCLESKIAMIVKCIKKNDPKSTITTSTVKDILKTIITYNILLARVKNEAISTMLKLKDDYEKALNNALMLFNSSDLASIYRAVASIILPDSLPSVGSGFRLPNTISDRKYSITSVTVSGTTATISGESNG